jgi:hypothetical protein
MLCAAHGDPERRVHLRIINGNSWTRCTRTRGPEGLVADTRRANGAGGKGLDVDEDAERNHDGPHRPWERLAGSFARDEIRGQNYKN